MVATRVAITPTSKIEIVLAPQFEHGDRKQILGIPGEAANDIFLTDLPQMDDNSHASFDYLIQQLAEELDQEGRNKPSWFKTNGMRYAGADIYALYDVWHYHSGDWDAAQGRSVYIPTDSGHTKVKDLQPNPLGMTSGPCIHFAWENNDKRVRILAYSKRHTPYFRASEPGNNLTSRILAPL